MKADVPRPLSAERLGGLALGYAGAFLGLLLLVALLEWSGTPDRTVGILFLCFVLVSVPVVGMLRRASDLADFVVAGRRVSAVSAGMAGAADAIAPAVLLAAAGSLRRADDAGFVALGFASGSVLATVLIVPFLRKLGGFTVADFMAARFGGGLARLMATVMLAACSLSYLIALACGAALIGARLLDMDFTVALYAVLAAIALGSFFGGLRAAIALQAIQYVVLIVTGLGAVAILAARTFDLNLTDMSYERLIEALNAVVTAVTTAGPAAAGPGARLSAFGIDETANLLGLALGLILGAASLPSILVRATATPTVREARRGGAWTVVFLLLLSNIAMAYVALSNRELNVEVTGVVAMLVATLGLAALLSSASGVMLTIANSLAHDLVHKMIARRASPAVRLIAARILLVAVAAFAGYAASIVAADGPAMLAWAFALAASGFFPALVLGVWWKRAGTAAGLCGMLAGFGTCLAYIVVTHYYPQIGIDYLGMSALPAAAGAPKAVTSDVGWFGIRNTAAGLFGLPVGFLTIILVARLSKTPPAEVQTFLDDIRRPRGAPPPSPAPLAMTQPGP